jgi:hypothetical protein
MAPCPGASHSGAAHAPLMKTRPGAAQALVAPRPVASHPGAAHAPLMKTRPGAALAFVV